LLLALGAPAASYAQDLVTDRPDFTESAVTVPAGLRQLEGGYTFARSGEVDTHALGELLLRIGLSRRLEFRGELNSHVWQRTPEASASEFDDPGIGVKLAIANPEYGATLLGATSALIVGTSVPVERSGSLQPEAKLLLAWDLSESASFSSNLNAARLRDEIGGYWETSASASLGLTLAERVGMYLEAYGFAAAGREDPAYLNGGVTLLLSPEVQLDLRVGARTDRGNERFFGVGLAHRW
jgi:hypothetical protein